MCSENETRGCERLLLIEVACACFLFLFSKPLNRFGLLDLMQEVNHFCTVCADCS